MTHGPARPTSTRFDMLRTALIAAAALAAASAPLRAQATSTLRAAASGRASTEVTVAPPGENAAGAAMKISIDHGQPHLRGRRLHEGGLVPLDTIWRTGANEATTLVTPLDLTIGGVSVPKGEYTLYTLPSRSGWKLIINRKTRQWGTEYDASQDLARVDLRLRTLSEPIESLTFWLIPATDAPARGELRLAWGTVEASVPWSVR